MLRATNKLILPLVMALFAPMLASPSSARALENRVWGSNFARATCTGPQHDSTPGTHWAKLDSPTILASECLLAPRAGVARPGELYGRQGPREFTGSQIKRLKKSMKASGYDSSKPIDIVEVNGRKIIIDGHHRARAAGAAKIKEVPVRIHAVDAATAARLDQEAAQAAHELGLSHRW
jgi:hypothetical protein